MALWWNKGLRDVIDDGFAADNHYTIILETIRIIQSWTQYAGEASKRFDFFKLKTAARDFGLWMDKLLRGLSTQSPDSAAIKSKIALLLCVMRAEGWATLSDETRSLLLRFARDSLNDIKYPSVRGCACKAVGTLLSFHLKGEHRKYYHLIISDLLGFMNKWIEALSKNKKQKKQEYALISKASCAMANLCSSPRERRLSTKQLFIYSSGTISNDSTY